MLTRKNLWEKNKLKKWKNNKKTKFYKWKFIWKVRLNKLDKILKPWRRKSCHPAHLIFHSFDHPFYVLQNQQRICNDPVLPWMDGIQSWSGWYSPLQKYLKARTILQACLHIMKKLQKNCQIFFFWSNEVRDIMDTSQFMWSFGRN